MDDPRITGHLRRKTWPLAAFLVGLLSCELVQFDGGGAASLIEGALIGIILAAGAFTLAKFMSERGPTKTYVPFSGAYGSDRPLLDLLFVVSTIGSIVLVLVGFRGLVPTLIGMIPVVIIASGGAKLLEEPGSESLSQYEMIERLQLLANDPSASETMRAGAAARLEAFASLEK